MTIDKAIEILNETLSFQGKWYDPTYKEATKLGIEALKIVKAIHNKTPVRIWEPLPGETKD